MVATLTAPLLISLDVASTSTKCNELQNDLNNKRVKTPIDANHLTIHKLEVMLERLNGKQGLGFLVGVAGGHQLLNTRMLVTLGKLLATAGAAGIPILSQPAIDFFVQT